jgi:hemoglobin-like flavoprotein
MLSTAQIAIVKDTWNRNIHPDLQHTGRIFYTRLFELDPSLNELFKGDLDQQSLNFMKIMQSLVDSLETLEEVKPTLENMGVRHVGYGVQDEDYALFGQALLWALAQKMKHEFTDDVRDAWQTTYNVLTDIMQKDAERAASLA